MRAYAYRGVFEPGDRRGNIVVTFPDVPEAVTQGRGEADARAMAEEVLGLPQHRKEIGWSVVVLSKTNLCGLAKGIFKINL